MSLLLDALKRAEQAKKAKSDEVAAGGATADLPGAVAPTRPTEKRVINS